MDVTGNANHIRDMSNKLSLYYVGLALLVAFAFCIQTLCFEFTGFRLVTRLRTKTFENMLYQDMEFFDNPGNNTGVILWMAVYFSTFVFLSRCIYLCIHPMFNYWVYASSLQGFCPLFFRLIVKLLEVSRELIWQ